MARWHKPPPNTWRAFTSIPLFIHQRRHSHDSVHVLEALCVRSGLGVDSMGLHRPEAATLKRSARTAMGESPAPSVHHGAASIFEQLNATEWPHWRQACSPTVGPRRRHMPSTSFAPRSLPTHWKQPTACKTKIPAHIRPFGALPLGCFSS